MPSISTVKIDAVYSHPASDSLDMLLLQNTPVAATRGLYRIGDTVIHFQPGTLIPASLAVQLDVSDWLLTDIYPGETEKTHCLVTTRLVGNLPSYGFVMETDLDPGIDLTNYYAGIDCKNTQIVDGRFHTYSQIPSYYDTSGRFKMPELHVRVTEKIDGVHSRIGYIGSEFLYGSKSAVESDTSIYKNPLTLNMKRMLTAISDGKNDVIAFGEIYGSKVKLMDYGTYGSDGYVLYDISINGEYIEWRDLVELTRLFKIRLVPIIYEGISTHDTLSRMVSGVTLVSESYIIRSKFKGREGIVLTPTVEQKFLDGSRMIHKAVSAEYLVACNPN